ncbi:MAG: D-2-hydroxyacid dehydrogenase [Planctomycetota bacterium]
MKNLMLVLMMSIVFALAGCASSTSKSMDAGHGEVIRLLNRHTEVPLLFIAGSLTDEDLATLRESAPNVHVVIPSSDEDVIRFAADAHGMDARFISDDVMAVADNLMWVQSPSAGVERYLRVDALRERDDIIMTNMQGVHGPTIAEHAFGMLLTITRDLRYYTHPDQLGTWNRRGSGAQPVALNGKTLFVVGLGGIGREVARIGDGFGMRVVATRRSQSTPPPYVDEQGTAADFDRFLAEADVVVLSVPLTDDTRGMIGAAQLAAMKPGSYLVNVARGPVVDTDALVDALQRGHLAGACLDVTDPEPLTPDHVLWTMPNVIITPHVSSRSPLTSAVWKRTYLDNIRRFGAGEPLVNVVDKAAGY